MLVFPWHAIFQVNIPFSLLHVQEGAGNIPSGFEGDIHSLYFPVFLLCCLTPRGHNLSKESCYHRGKPSLEWVEWFSFLEGVLSFIIKSLSPEKGYVVQTEYNSETGENFEVISLHPSLTHHWESCLKSPDRSSLWGDENPNTLILKPFNHACRKIRLHISARAHKKLSRTLCFFTKWHV